MNRIFFTALLAIAACLFVPGVMEGQQPAAQLDSLFTKMYKDQKFFGNVLFAENGNIIYRKSFGKANYSTNADLNDETMFELASVSKQFTAMGIMVLQKQGKLKYEDSLRKFFPELPYENITVRHLLNHTSGLPDYMGLFSKKWDSTKIATNKDIIALLAKEKPAMLSGPGEKWEYSNTGYALLASIIEKVSGMEFGKYLEQHVFKPLGMTRTQVFRRRFEKRLPENYALGYGWHAPAGKFILPDSAEGVSTMVYTLDGIVGDGTVNSTVNDLLKWDQALYTEKLVSKAMLEEAFTPAKLNDGKTFNYGFGWGISNSYGGRALSHSGGWPGYNTFIERHPETGKLIIFLRNHDTGSPLPLQNIRKILYGIKDSIPSQQSTDSASVVPYRGEYELAPGFSITISTEGSRIFAQATGQARFEIFQEQKDVFFLKVVEAKIKFTRNDKGIVTGMMLYQNGQEVEGVKKN